MIKKFLSVAVTVCMLGSVTVVLLYSMSLMRQEQAFPTITRSIFFMIFTRTNFSQINSSMYITKANDAAMIELLDYLASKKQLVLTDRMGASVTFIGRDGEKVQGISRMFTSFFTLLDIGATGIE